jgi:hypothetical protein
VKTLICNLKRRPVHETGAAPQEDLMTDTTIDLRAVERRGTWLDAALARPLGRSWIEALAHALKTIRPNETPASRAEREAAAVRELALRYRETDRGFAADLLAAADRHEQDAHSDRHGSAASRR